MVLGHLNIPGAINQPSVQLCWKSNYYNSTDIYMTTEEKKNAWPYKYQPKKQCLKYWLKYI